MRARLNLYDLYRTPDRGWAGWHCTHVGRYREEPVAVPDLDALPRSAHVRLNGRRWWR